MEIKIVTAADLPLEEQIKSQQKLVAYYDTVKNLHIRETGSAGGWSSATRRAKQVLKDLETQLQK